MTTEIVVWDTFIRSFCILHVVEFLSEFPETRLGKMRLLVLCQDLSNNYVYTIHIMYCIVFIIVCIFTVYRVIFFHHESGYISESNLCAVFFSGKLVVNSIFFIFFKCLSPTPVYWMLKLYRLSIFKWKPGISILNS